MFKVVDFIIAFFFLAKLAIEKKKRKITKIKRCFLLPGYVFGLMQNAGQSSVFMEIFAEW